MDEEKGLASNAACDEPTSPPTGRPSAASTAAPSVGVAYKQFTSSASPHRSSEASTPLILTDEDNSPELTQPRSLGRSSFGKSPPACPNLAPAETAQSLIRSVADVPHGSPEERLAGLTSAVAAAKLQEYGRNEIPEHVEPWYYMLFKQFVGMMPFMLEIAAVLSGITKDWSMFSIIMFMLVVNGLIGFYEERKAQQSLDALKSQMTATVPVKRDGAMVILPVAELVPGDVIFLRGGNVVPADAEWLEGDPMLVDTAALTGEPLPRKVPRPPRDGEPPEACRLLLSGCIIKQGEGHCLVKETGLRTEIGQAAGLVQEASGHVMGVFETKIMQVVRAVILITLVDAAVVLYVDVAHRNIKFTQALLGVLALVIGAVPIALPLVMQVTMVVGAGQMARRRAIVTHLTALQEVASMKVLCSDKTGTLTTADMRVLPSRTWTRRNYSRDDALVWAGVASNPANKEDPIDKAVLESCNEHFGEERAAALLTEYHKTKFVGFNPIVKRTVAYCTHPKRGEVKISKGLVDKVLITGDDGGDCWECADAASLRDELREVDQRFSVQGYKTVGVALAEGHGAPMQFAAIMPILDPPRTDTQLTIHRIREAGIGVKMITGDHLNIAVETSRLIGLGTNILPATDLWPASATRDEMIMTADGFAQVLPKDKREVVLVLQNAGLVVGMTGDGVNDAPALAQAQIGIAVDGATEAARSAADIILTAPGLSAIYDAVVESRRIFARLRAYVLYRVAATIQIVVVLSLLIYVYKSNLKPLYVILLALLNDVTMLPIAYDNASPSSLPEIPSMAAIMLASMIYGLLETAQTMLLYTSGWLSGDEEYRNAVTYLQISIAIEFLIFSCRTPSFFLATLCGCTRPSASLAVAVIGANVLVSLMGGFGILVYKVKWADIGWIWLYDVAWLLVIDGLKWMLGACGLNWMTAQTQNGVLGYPDLPEVSADGAPAHGSTARLATVVRSSRASVRSIMLQSGASALTPALPTRGGGLLGGTPDRNIRSASTLPYPYNLRAASLHHHRSF